MTRLSICLCVAFLMVVGANTAAAKPGKGKGKGKGRPHAQPGLAKKEQANLEALTADRIAQIRDQHRREHGDCRCDVCEVTGEAAPGPNQGQEGIQGKGNNGVGNGLDPQPPGNPRVNDGEGAAPGAPGNRAAKDRSNQGKGKGAGESKGRGKGKAAGGPQGKGKGKGGGPKR